MLIREENCEYIAQVIGGQYSGYQLVEKLKKIGIPDEFVVYPNTKWRLVLGAINYCNSLEDVKKGSQLLSKIIELAVHPVNFSGTDMEIPAKVLSNLNNRLAYDKLCIRENNGEYLLVKLSNKPVVKTSTDYITEAINYFKNEYNKIRISGISYEYEIGPGIDSLLSMYDIEEVYEDIDETTAKTKAIEQLSKIGFIKEYVIEEKSKSNEPVGYNYAICTIDESKLTQQEEPIATDINVRKIVHEHTHRFENSIQDKDITVSVHNIQNSNSNNKLKSKFPFTIPSGTTWENIYIQFRNDESVTIKVSGHTHNTSFADMGFLDNRSNKPNIQWTLLRLFAKKGGGLPVSSPEAEDKYKKQKQLLSNSLKEYFSIDYDPFKTYNKNDGYVIKINLSYPKTEKANTEYSLNDEIGEMFQSFAE